RHRAPRRATSSPKPPGPTRPERSLGDGHPATDARTTRCRRPQIRRPSLVITSNPPCYAPGPSGARSPPRRQLKPGIVPDQTPGPDGAHLPLGVPLALPGLPIDPEWKAQPRLWGHSLHPMCSSLASFPAALVHAFVARYSRPGDVVLDPFSGRGTAPVQAAAEG